MKLKFSVHIASGAVYKTKHPRLTHRDTGDVIIQRSPVLQFTIDYPLTNPRKVEVVHENEAPWTQNEFIEAVRIAYADTYAAEKNPGHVPGMLNRGTSDGPYRIWGHDLEDLVLEGAVRQPDGSWELIVGS